MSVLPGHDSGPGGLVHPAVFYHGEREYLDALVPFITGGLDDGHPVATAVPTDNLALLRRALGAAAARVTMIDMTEAGSNPGRILPAVLHSFADAHPGIPVRIVGEPIWPDRPPTAYPACVQHEALINSAFAGRNVTIVCPYDAAALHPDVLTDALRTHPVVWGRYGLRPSTHFDPDGAFADYNLPLAAGSAIASLDVRSLDQLPELRRAAATYALDVGLSPDRAHDLQYIVTELVTNSLVHSRGGCRLRISREDGYLVCAVSDAGQLLDPLAGRRRPPADRAGGRGLLMINYLADLVRMHTSPEATTIQAYLSVSPLPVDRGVG